MVGSILQVAGVVMSGVQAYQANQKQKQAEASAVALANQAKNLKLTNAYADLKVADAGEKLALEYGAAADVSQLEALKASPEGAVAVAGVAREGTLRDLEIGAALSEKEAERNRLRAEGQRLADTENFRTQQDMLSQQIQGAQTAAADAEATKNAAITSAVSGAGSVLEQSMPAGGDYKSEQRQADRSLRQANRAATKSSKKTNVSEFGVENQANVFGMNNVDDPYQLGELYR
jgi:hypothetical protein